jgi:hypothetical protein
MMTDTPDTTEAVADAIRGGCPELFTDNYSDFPDLVAAQVIEAHNKALAEAVPPVLLGAPPKRDYPTGWTDGFNAARLLILREAAGA